MAKDANRRPRIRKTAPTVREKMEAAQAKAQTPAKPARKLSIKTPRFVRGKHLSNLKAFQKAAPVLSPIGKFLAKLAPRYLINSWREVRQVQWPNRRETWRLTLAVFIFAIVFGALVAGVDKGLDEVFKKLVLK